MILKVFLSLGLQTVKNNKSVIIISGGQIQEELLRQVISQNPIRQIIVVDGGLKIAHDMELHIDYIVGDFDTVPRELLDKYKGRDENNCNLPIVIEYPPEKDATDTHIALELAISLFPSEIIILGGTGTRLDHTIANIHLLLLALEHNIKTSLIDFNNKIYLIDKPISIKKSKTHGKYVSLLPFTETVEGLTLEGFKYPLYNKTLEMGKSLGISNEIIEKKASIQLSKGILMVIEARD